MHDTMGKLTALQNELEKRITNENATKTNLFRPVTIPFDARAQENKTEWKTLCRQTDG